VLDGFSLDIKIFMVVEVAVLVLGLVVAVARSTQSPALFPLRLLGATYTDMLRGIPTILVVYLIGFGVPALELSGVPSDPVVLGGIALTLSYSAYVAEVYRAGIDSVHPSQRSAALAIGLTPAQSTRFVVLPQAVRRVVPPPSTTSSRFRSTCRPSRSSARWRRSGSRRSRRPRRQLHAAGGGRLSLPARDGAARARGRSHAGAGPPATRRGGARVIAPVLELQGVTKAYGHTPVLRGVDSAVNEHEAIALIGASGSGKSTLLRCVDLLEVIDDGDLLLDGEVITDPAVDPVPVRRRLGLAFQAFNLFPHLTVLENVVLGPARAHGMGRSEAVDTARALLERFGLGGRRAEYPDRLSGGQQQRVAIVRALATRPRALLLDEITSALDPELVGEVLALVRGLKQEG
jgi:polar amino acid transport system ATP-binding protein